jgi:hypothetical protein
VNRSVVHAQEFADALVTFGSMCGRSRAKLKKRSEPGRDGERNAIRVVDRDTSQVFALAEAIHQSLQAFVWQRPVKLWFDIFLQAFAEDFRAAGKIVAKDAAVGAYLVTREEERNYNHANNEGRNEFQGRAHQYFPLGKSEDMCLDSLRVIRIHGAKKRRYREVFGAWTTT